MLYSQVLNAIIRERFILKILQKIKSESNLGWSYY